MSIEISKMCNPKSIGKRIKHAMINVGLSGYDVAQRVSQLLGHDFSRVNIYNYTGGKCTPKNAEIYVCLSIVLGVSVDWILTGKKGGVYAEQAALNALEREFS